MWFSKKKNELEKEDNMVAMTTRIAVKCSLCDRVMKSTGAVHEDGVVVMLAIPCKCSPYQNMRA